MRVEKKEMEKIAERAFRCLAFRHLAFFFAATLATTSAWAAESNMSYITPGTNTFSSVVASLGNYGTRFVYVGAANDEANPFKPQTPSPCDEEIWRVWKSKEDPENPGEYPYGYNLVNYPKWASLWVANDSSQYGRLKIESGVYNFARGGSNYNNMTIAGTDSEGYIWQTGGSLSLTDGGQPAILGNGGTAEYLLDAGTFFCASDFYFGNMGDETTTQKIIINGGTFQNGTLTSGKWFKLGENGTGARTIDINAGGTCALCHFENYATGTTAINLNGGTLKQLFTDTNNCKYLIGSHDHTDDSVTVTVTQDSTLDTSGKDVHIKNVVIGGTGTLDIVGGGSVTFETLPTCKITSSDGTFVMPSSLVRNITGEIILGKDEYLGFDLSSHTTVGETVTLAENVSLSTANDSPVAEHIVIKNSGVFWDVSYSENKLTATSVSTRTGDWSIFTGYYDGNHPPDQNKSWVNGRPDLSTRVIVPGYVGFMQMWGNLDCGSLEMHGDFTLTGANQYQHIRAKAITGEGTLTFGANRSDVTYAWLESQVDVQNAPLEIDVPVIIVNAAKITSRTGNSSPVKFNKSFEVSSGAVCDVHTGDGLGAPVFNDDVTIDGELINSHGTTIASGKKLFGSGTITGDLTMSSSATLGITIASDGTCTPLTVSGTANITGATLAVEGGDYLAEAADGATITLFKAATITGWTEGTTVEIGGAPWSVSVGEAEDGKYPLVATKQAGVAVEVEGGITAVTDSALITFLTNNNAKATPNTENANGVTAVMAYMLGYSEYTPETVAPAIAKPVVAAEGWTLSFAGVTPASVSGLKLQYYIEQSATPDFANATVVGNVQDNAPVALSLSNIDATKPYHRLCAKIVATE